jgi:hypothetical protein
VGTNNVGYDVRVCTSFGHIKTDFSITTSGDLGTDSLNGRIGKGGCQLSLRNSNRSIEILKGLRQFHGPAVLLDRSASTRKFRFTYLGQ